VCFAIFAGVVADGVEDEVAKASVSVRVEQGSILISPQPNKNPRQGRICCWVAGAGFQAFTLVAAAARFQQNEVKIHNSPRSTKKPAQGGLFCWLRE
jgi:hypothetical protein